MNISNIYIGGWFQRTMLQLSEIYDFLRDNKTRLDLDKKKLETFRKKLEIGNINYNVSGQEYLEFTTALNIKIKIFEDGLIILNNSEVSEDTLFTDIDKVQDYYENRLSPAINYLFSLGAPVPKELANIENVYPYFVVCNNASKEYLSNLLSKTEKQKYFEFENDKYDVLRGDKYYFINKKTKDADIIERFIEEQVFIREFKGQLHRYLNLHRIIWEKIDKVKNSSNIKGKEIVRFTTLLDGYAKTINLIDGRIKQMSTYISTREKIAKNDKDLYDFLEISGYKYETLKDTLDYIKSLWDMTKNYVVSAQKLFEGLKSDVSNKSISNLTMITSMSAGSSILMAISRSKPEFTIYSWMYALILAIVVWTLNKIVKNISKNKKYKITDVDYINDIK